MRRVDIEFVESQQRWWIWGGAVLVCIGLSLVFFEFCERTRQENLGLGENVLKLQKQISKVEGKPILVESHPRRANLELVYRTLQQDVNGIFGVIEKPPEKGAHLKGVSFDLAS